MSNYQTILYSTEQTTGQNIAQITLNRPERRNAVTAELLDELTDAFGRAAADEQVRAVVLTGAGKGFCAGQDLSAFGGIMTPEQVRSAVIDHYMPLILAICRLPKPIIGAINGVAAGAGCSLALACDLRIMADDASQLQAFSNIGLVPDAGSSWFLTRLVGYSRAYEIAISGERVTAQRCLELGLANRVVPADALLAEALAWAAQLAQRPTYALGLTKQVMQEAALSDLATIIQREAEFQGQCVQSADHHEGVLAFMQKRQPVFSGR